MYKPYKPEPVVKALTIVLLFLAIVGVCALTSILIIEAAI